jgi:hypothetical protein
LDLADIDDLNLSYQSRTDHPNRCPSTIGRNEIALRPSESKGLFFIDEGERSTTVDHEVESR